MRATRAYLAGLGTSGTLLAGAALMFVLASAIVGFKGWPQVDAQPSTASLQAVQTRLPGGGSAATGAHGPAALQAAVAAQAPGTGGGATGSGAGSTASGGPAAPNTISQRFAPTPQSPGHTPGAITSSSNQGCPDCPATGQQPGLGSQVGSAATGAGGTAGSTVSGAAGTVGGQVGGTSPAAGGVIKSAGGTVGGAVSGTAQSTGGLVSGAGH